MSDKGKKNPSHIEVQQKIVHLLLQSKRTIEELIDENYSADLFDGDYKYLVDAIFSAYLNGARLLTPEGFRQSIISQGRQSDQLQLMELYSKCDLQVYTTFDDLWYLKEQLVNSYVGKTTNEALEIWHKHKDKVGYHKATEELINILNLNLSTADFNRISLVSLSEAKHKYMEELKQRRDNPSAVIRCGIKEIDDVLPTGFEAMDTTLIVAEPGGHKSNLMLNMALNIWEKGHPVLYIQLEMKRNQIIHRIVANRVGIPFTRLARPEMLSPDEVKQIDEAKVFLENEKNPFVMMDSTDRIGVSVLKNEVQKRCYVFKPVLVVIDYIAILKPDRYTARNDLDIGEILKDLKFLGKKFNFHLLSAVQMGRQSIRALRESGQDAVPDSTSLRGSHEYSADAANIFALMRLQDEPDRLKMYTIKSRHGPSAQTQQLMVDAPLCRITGTDHGGSLLGDDGLDIDESINTPSEVIINDDPLPDLGFAGSGFDDGEETDDDLLGI